MEETYKDLPEECWELIVSRVGHHQQWEPLSLVSKRLLSITNLMRTSLKVINPSTDVLSKQLQRFPHLKKFDLREISESLEVALPKIASSGVDIEELSISRSSNRATKLLAELSSKMKNMRVLSFTNSDLNNNDLEVLSRCFPSLEVLYLNCQSTQNITDKGIVALSKNLKHLQKINLTANSKITDESVIALSSNCQHLTEIVLRYCSYMSQSGLSFAMENSQSLTSFIFAASWFYPLELTNPFNLSKHITTIDLCRVSISDDLLYEIAKADLPLINIHLRSCKNFTLSGISSLLKAYQSLKSLSLDDTVFLTEESVMYLCQFIPKLISLNLENCFNLTAASFVAVSSACPLLESIKMDISPPMNSSGLQCASGSTKVLCLTSASLRGHMISGVLHICPNLQFLKVDEFGKQEPDIAVILECCRKLQLLTIAGAKKLKFSEEWNEEACSLEYLSLQKSEGTNDQVLEMVGKRCRKLVYLNLQDCWSVTERGVREIVEHCRQLRQINLDHCHQVSPNFVSWMVSSCPSLRRIVSTSPGDHSEEEIQSLLRQGCLIVPGTDDQEYYDF